MLHPPWRSDDTSWGTNHTNKASQQDFLLCWNLNYFVLHALLPSILFEFVLALSQALVDQCIISHCIPIGQLVVSSHTEMLVLHFWYFMNFASGLVGLKTNITLNLSYYVT